MSNRENKRPPRKLRDKPLPEWTRAERERHEPADKVWDRNGQRWVSG